MIRTGAQRRSVPGGIEAPGGVEAPQDAGAPGDLDVPGGPEAPAGPGQGGDLAGGASGGGANDDGGEGDLASGDGAATTGRARAPRWLEAAGAWSWRLIVVGIVIYFGARAVSVLRIVVLPCVGALLLTALLQPLAARLRRVGMNGLAATWCTLLLAIAILAGAGTLVGIRVSQESGTITSELTRSTHQFEHWLVNGPFHVRQHAIQQFSNTALTWFNQHRSLVAGTVVTGGRIALEIVAGVVLMLFVTFFFIKDGDRIWRWMTGALGSPGARRVDRAGREAWLTLVHYIRGTVVVAAIHAAVIGLALLIIGVPLVGPLTLLVFLASFVPLIGILVAGFIAILVTLGTKGLIAAIVLLAIFIIENQVESHLLQPLVVGRMVRLHPLAIILVLAVGGVVGGIPGAIVAVPTAAAITRAWPLLRDAPPGEDEAAEDPGAGKVAAGEPDRT